MSASNTLVRKFERSVAEGSISKTERISVALFDDDDDSDARISTHDGELVIEYQPKDHVLTTEGLIALYEEYDTLDPEEFVQAMFSDIVDQCYPGLAMYDDLTDKVPMVLTFKYSNPETVNSRESTITVGQFW